MSRREKKRGACENLVVELVEDTKVSYVTSSVRGPVTRKQEAINRSKNHISTFFSAGALRYSIILIIQKTIDHNTMTILSQSLFMALLVNGCVSLSPQHHQVQRPFAPPSTLPSDNQRRHFLLAGSLIGILTPASVASAASPPQQKKCTDIESCREIGDQKTQEDLQNNPITRLENDVRYKRLKPGVGSASVQDKDVVDIVYSISRSNGSYMYSQGFGFEKAKDGIGGSPTDEGLDSYRVRLGSRDVPVGIEQALMGMKKGERRRVEVPPSVGFETSEWRPEPTTRRGKTQIADYQTILKGRGTNQPPFPAPLIWDVEVLSFRASR
jgi:hypothetical protein